MNAVWQGIAGTPSTSGIGYYKVNHSLSNAAAVGPNNFNTTIAICPISDDIVITGLTVWTTAPPGASASWTMAVQTSTDVFKNNSGTFTTSAASVTLSGSSSTTASWSGSVAVSQATFLNMILTPSGNPAATTTICWAISYRTAGNFYLVPSQSDGAIQNGASTVYYGPLFGSYTAVPTTTAATWGMPAASSFTVTKIIAYSNQQGTMGTSSKTYAVYNTTTSTASSFTSVATGSTTCLGAVGTGSMTFTAGQQISYRVTCVNSPGWASEFICLTVVPNNAGEVMNGFLSTSAPSTSAVNYQSANGAGVSAWNAAEVGVAVRFLAGTLKNFYMRVTTAPGTSKSYVFALRSNSSGTGISGTVSASSITASDTTNSVAITDGSEISIQSTPAGTPAGTGRVTLSFIHFVPQTDVNFMRLF